MKIGRNDLCPCESGKKYKKCCIDKPQPNPLNLTQPMRNLRRNPFFEKYSTVSLLQSFAGLSLMPENHGKYVRMEELARIALQSSNDNSETPSFATMKAFLDKEYPAHHSEDPQINLFTDLVTYYGGDYLVFPGITESGTFALSNLLAAIFHWPNSGIPDQYVSNCSHTLSLIFAISDTIAKRLGYTRYQKGTASYQMIEVPSDNSLDKLRAAVTFTVAEMKEICRVHQISEEAINEFLIDPNSPEIKTPYTEESPLIYKPILYADDKYIVASPATLSFAITDYIWTVSKSMGCSKEVKDAYHSVLWNNLQMQLGQMGFKRLNINLVSKTPSSGREGLYKFDDDKIAYVQYLSTESGLKSPKEKDEIIAQILATPEFVGYEVLDFVILSPTGNGFVYPLIKVEHARSITFPIYELEALWNLKDTSALDLWKFAIAREEQLQNIETFTLSTLDLYKVYKDHQDSFYISDNTRFNHLHIHVGYADELFEKAKIKTDKHSALKNIGGRFANVQVERKDKYAPIYVDLMGLSSSELEFLVDGFYQPVWITANADLTLVTGELRNIYWQLNDAIAYWTWQIQDDVKGDLGLLRNNPITITYDLHPIDKFETISTDFTRAPNLSDKFQTTSSMDSFNVTIPFEVIPYLYGADNEGERVLVRNLLIGMNKLLEVNNKPQITEDRITVIVESKAPLGMKKKLFMLDTNDNLLIDPRNIEEHRYVQEYDTSAVLDSIVPALGAQCPPVGEIRTREERNALCFSIVERVLLPLIKSKISQYDSTELLKRLISQNESLIKEKEELRIYTPTRIACFVSIEQQTADLQKSLANVNRTSIATRCLIEHVAAEPSKGTKIISNAAIDELVAIMDQVITWGSLSDQIHFNLFDIKMSVLPSGRIGTEKQKLSEIFDSYYESKTKEDVTDAISSFDQVFPQIDKIEGKEVPKNLDAAFLSDYGISFTRICEFLDSLCHIGFLQSTPYSSLPVDELRAAVNIYATRFEEAEFNSAIAFLSLSNRGGIEKLPKGFAFVDIMPWRFNRILSFLRKPIVLVDAVTSGGSKIAYWGARQVLASKGYFVSQLYSDRFRVFDKSEVKKVLGKFAQERGDALVKKVTESINPEKLVIDHDVYIGPGFELKNDIDIGDVDILIIDVKSKVLFSLECKSMSPSRDIKEMVEEVEKLFGSDSEIGWLGKHVRRHEWLEANRDQISKKYKIDTTDFKITSIFITNEDMLTPYLRKQTLPIPIVTSYEIEKGGYAFLKNFAN